MKARKLPWLEGKTFPHFRTANFQDACEVSSSINSFPRFSSRRNFLIARENWKNNDVPLIEHLSWATLLRSLLTGKSFFFGLFAGKFFLRRTMQFGTCTESVNFMERDCGLKIDGRWVQAPLMDVFRKLNRIDCNLWPTRVLSPRLPIHSGVY